uniref:Transmembrane protein n=1 Tax=Parastrongyloides trichosuri TaxID=131310 RepID=A0A0N4ZL71_PARTI
MSSLWSAISNEIKMNTLQYLLVSAGAIGVVLVVLTYYNDEDIFPSLTETQRKRRIKKEMRKMEKSLIKRKRRMQEFREKIARKSDSIPSVSSKYFY